MLIAQISGYSGSGKTTLGNIIKYDYPQILVKELDEFLYEIDYEQLSAEDAHDEMKKKMQTCLDENPDSKIIFVGIGNCVYTDFDKYSDSEMADIYPTLPGCRHLIWLDTPIKLACSRAVRRHFNHAINNMNKILAKMEKQSEDEIDINLKSYYNYQSRVKGGRQLKKIFMSKDFIPMKQQKIMEIVESAISLCDE